LNSSIRKKLIALHYKKQSIHLGSSLSCIDIISSILLELKIPFRDFILSKGHASTALYVCLNELGVISNSLLDSYYENGTHLTAHPIFESGFVDFSTGSLGHGLSFGIGISISNNLLNKKGNIIVLMSDGECNEGSVWEAAGFATAQKLSNLIVLIDSNKWQATGRSKEIFGGDLKKKWEAFGWKTVSINGHNYFQILKSLKIAKESKRPCAIIANTVKGKGIEFMEDDNNWHYRIPNREELKNIKKMLNI